MQRWVNRGSSDLRSGVGMRDLRVPEGSDKGALVLASLPVLKGPMPLGLIALSGFLENRFIPHRVLDATQHSHHVETILQGHAERAVLLDEPSRVRREALAQALRKWPDILDYYASILAEGGERVVGLSLFRTNADLSVLVAQRLKKIHPDRLVVLGGPELLGRGKEYAELECVDAAVEGEGEFHLLTIVHSALENHPLEAAPFAGLGTGTCCDGLKPAISAHWETISYRPMALRFAQDDLDPLKELVIPILFSRGCSRRCRFCFVPQHLGRWRSPTVEQHIRQIEVIRSLMASHDVQLTSTSITLDYYDNIFNGHRWTCERLLEAMTGAVSSLPKACHVGEAVALLDRGFIRKLLCAGFRSISIGVESGSDRVRRAMGKPMKIEQVRQMIDLLLEEGVECLTLLLMIGWPDETKEEFAQTLRLIEQYDDQRIRFHVQPFQVYLGADFPDWPGLAKPNASGIRWRASTAAGDPAERFARYEAVRELLHGRNILLPVYDMQMLKEWMVGKGGANAGRKLQEVVLVEFISGDYPDQAALLPYAFSLVKQRATVPVCWLRFPSEKAPQKDARELRDNDRLSLTKSLPLHGPAAIIFSEMPSVELRDFLRRINPHLHIGWIANLGATDTPCKEVLDSRTKSWCKFLSLPQYVDDKYYLFDTVEPRFACTPGAQEAENSGYVPTLVFGCFTEVAFASGDARKDDKKARCHASERVTKKRAKQVLSALLQDLPHLPISHKKIRLIGSRVLKDLGNIVSAVLEVFPPQCEWVLEVSPKEVMRYRERLERAAYLLGTKGHKLLVSLRNEIGLCAGGSDGFSRRSPLMQTLAAVEALSQIEQSYASSFRFTLVSVLDSRLQQRASVPYEIALAVIRAGKLGKVSSLLSKAGFLRQLAEQCPRQGGASQKDTKHELDASALIEREMGRILLRLANPAQDQLGRNLKEMLEAGAARNLDVYDVAQGLGDLLACVSLRQGKATSEDITRLVLETIQSEEMSLCLPPTIAMLAAKPAEDLARLECELSVQLELLRRGVMCVGMLEALTPTTAHSLLNVTSLPNPSLVSRKGLFDLIFGTSKSQVREMALLRTCAASLRPSEEVLVSIGRLLGYPECCVRAYAERNAYNPEADRWLLLEARLHTPGPVAPEASAFLMFECLPVPCSLKCEKALTMAQEVLGIIERLRPQHAIALRGLMTRPLLVSLEKEGSFVALKPGKACFRFSRESVLDHGWFAELARLFDEVRLWKSRLVLARNGFSGLDLTARAYVWWYKKAFQGDLLSQILKIRRIRGRQIAQSATEVRRDLFVRGGAMSCRCFEWLLGLDAGLPGWRVRFVGATAERVIVVVTRDNRDAVFLTLENRGSMERVWINSSGLAISYKSLGQIPVEMEQAVLSIGLKRLGGLNVADLVGLLQADEGSSRGEEAKKAIEAVLRATV